MQVAMITCRREPGYVAKSIESLFNASSDEFVHTSRRLALYADGNIDEGLELAQQWAPAIIVEGQDVNEIRLAGASPSRAGRALRNFARALRDGDGGILILEDDIVVKPGWEKALAQAREAAGENNFVSLYAHPRVAEYMRARGVEGVDGETRTVDVPGQLFYGTLALYVPRALRRALSQNIDDSLRAGAAAPFDTTVAAFAWTRKHAIYVTAPSFVDHIGEVSAIPANDDKGPRKSPLF